MPAQESGEKEGSVTVAVSTVIDRPVADVFRWYGDDHVRNHPRWDPDLKLEKTTEGPIGVGTVIRRLNTRYETPVEETMEIVTYEPERAIEAVITGGPVEMHGNATFEELAPDRTELTIGVEMPDSMDEEMIRSAMERSARTIKELAEADL